MIEYGRFFTKLYRIRRGYYRRNITIRLSVGYEYRLKNKEIFKEVFVSLRGRNIATFKFKLAAQLYVYDALKKKITILTNIQN